MLGTRIRRKMIAPERASLMPADLLLLQRIAGILLCGRRIDSSPIHTPQGRSSRNCGTTDR